ncbi:MAG: hypothetical protein SFY66_02240 [Oculatellaceae cyanobacterium bins.114]|nr:hypothetical protein [Oculatellaceae cyanobacterium bins.114]
MVQDIYNGMPYSQAEVYLTALGQLSDEEIWQYGDRVCESLRRGGNIKIITEQIASQFATHEESFVHNQIMSVAGKQLCPESSFPPAGLPRSLFFMWERLNGGAPL